jgi:hypothetical protein
MGMPELIALRGVFGQDEANHGTMRYRVDSDGLVRVPVEAAFFLINNGGFAVAKTTVAHVPGRSHPVPPPENARSAAEPRSLVRLHHNAAGGCSHGGRRYQSDENGDVLVPAEAVVDLMAHGFVPATQDPYPGEATLMTAPMARG